MSLRPILLVCLTWAGACAAQPTHCKPGEKIFFNCSVRGGKVISVCGSTAVSANSGYLQYRFGKPGRPEFEFPSALEGSQRKFDLESHRPYQGESELLHFSSANYEYSVYQAAGTDPTPFRSAGVFVSRAAPDGASTSIEIKCGARRVESLAELSGIVRTSE